MKHLFAIQAFGRTGSFFAGALIVALLLVPQLRAQNVVTNGSADEFKAVLKNVVSNGGGTILVMTPVVIDATNGPEIFDGVSNVVVSGGNTNSIFIIGDGGDLTLSNMTLANGVSTNGGAVYIFENGTATFNNCVFSNNLALGAVGISAIVNTNGAGSTNGTTNTVSGSNSRNGSKAGPAFGGAIFNLGNVTALNCAFLTNSAIGGTGGDGADGNDGNTRGGNGGKGAAGGAAFGGGIYTTGPLLVVNTTFSGNAAEGGAGGAGGAGGSGLIAGVTGNGAGGGSASGGGIYSTNSSALVVITNSTFANNLSSGGAGAVGGTSSAGTGQNGPHGGDAFGAGIENDVGSVMSLTNCTFFENTANGGGGGDGGVGGGRGGDGGTGGKAIGGGVYNAGTIVTMNCTFSKGSAAGGTNGVPGPGISSGRNGSKGSSQGGNIANVAKKKKGSFALQNSIVASSLSGGGGSGTIIDNGFNISADRSIAFKSAKKGGTSLAKTDPLVGDLAQNGGPTPTIAIFTNSPAVNFITNNIFPPYDQRGLKRPQLTFPDAGAFELNPNQLLFLVPPQSTNVPVGSNAFFSVTVGGPVLGFQWYYAPSNIVADTNDLLDGATNSLLTLTNVQLTNAGQFQVVVTNTLDAITSSVAVLTVSNILNFAPVITLQPVTQTVFQGDTATFTITATGTAPLMYQWQFQGTSFIFTNISGATNPVLTIPNAQITNQGNYFVTVTNNFGSTNSNIATLMVDTNGGGLPPP